VYEAAKTCSLLKQLANGLRQNDPQPLTRLAVSCGIGGLAGGFAVTWGRQESIRYRGTLHCCFPGDLPTRVDAISVLKKRSIGIMNETVEFCHRAILPKEGAISPRVARPSPRRLPAVVDCYGGER